MRGLAVFDLLVRSALRVQGVFQGGTAITEDFTCARRQTTTTDRHLITHEDGSVAETIL